MNRIGEYKINDFPKMRRNISLALEESIHKHSIHAIIEVDITEARKLIRRYKEITKKRISFTGWIVYCVAQAVAQHRELNTYKHGKRKSVVFNDVDVPIAIERVSNEEQIPMGYIIRKANEKSVWEINNEIREAQKQSVNESQQVLGNDVTKFERFIVKAPNFIQKIISYIVRRNAFLQKKHLGTVGVTSVGMFGKLPGWIITISIPTTLIVVGGITEKPRIINGQVHNREYLNLTITVDHDIVDGGPLSRFIDTLTELTENAIGLKDLIEHQSSSIK